MFFSVVNIQLSLMKKYFLALIPISIIIVYLVLTTEKENSIIGKWKSVDATSEFYYIFNEDKTCSYEMDVARLGCTYELEENKISILYKGNSDVKTFNYKIDGNSLIIQEESSQENKFIKVN